MLWFMLWACVAEEPNDENIPGELCVVINSGGEWTEAEYRSDGQLLVSEQHGGQEAYRVEYTYFSDNDWRILRAVEQYGDDEYVIQYDWSTDDDGNLVSSQYLEGSLMQTTVYRPDGYLLRDEFMRDNTRHAIEMTYVAPTSWKRQTYERWYYDYAGNANTLSSNQFTWDGLTATISEQNGGSRRATHRSDGRQLTVEFLTGDTVDMVRDFTYRTEDSWQLLHKIDTTFDTAGDVYEGHTGYAWYSCDG